MGESRRYIRAGIPFVIEVFFPNEETSFGAYGWSIGKGGLGFYTQKPLQKNSEILLKVGFMGDQNERPPEMATGLVRWVKPLGEVYAVGVQFVDLNEDDHFVLLGFLDHAEQISHEILKKTNF